MGSFDCAAKFASEFRRSAQDDSLNSDFAAQLKMTVLIRDDSLE